MTEADVQLLDTATADYRSVLVTSYLPVKAGEVLSLLRALGGGHAALADRYAVRLNGNRALADRVRLMVQSERRERGLPASKPCLTMPHGSDAS